MTKAEKRFFKLFCALQGKPKNYMRLFDEIERMKVYDETVLVKKIKDKKITDHLSVYKNYLYNQILKGLRVQYDNKAVERQLFGLITEADILMERNLSEPAQDRLDKAFKLAEAHHKFPLALLILQRKLITAVRDRQLKLQEEVESLYRDSLKKMEAFKEEFDNALLYRRIFVIHRKNKRNEIDKMLQNVQQEFELLELPQSDSFYARLYYFKSNAYFHLLNREREKAFSYFEEVVKLWEANSVIAKENSKTFKLELCNFLNAAATVDRYDLFPAVLARVAQLPSKTLDEEVETFSNHYFLELIYCFNTNHFERALSIIPQIEAGLEKYGQWITRGRLTTFHYNLAVLFIALEDFETAQIWLNKILHSDRMDAREDIQRISRIFELVIHFELENDRVLEYLFNSALNKLTKEEALHPFEALCFEYLKKLLNSPSNKDRLVQFILFKAALEDLGLPKQVRGSEEIDIWLEAKITGEAFIEVLAERKQRKS